ncbi:hypothetical protein AVEN_220791-1 [Araneus ventricosus]|uniref:Uncharacterized protein n=1 Tax=Araneus ventricosus TaxID=182803 RepID=A0A4Y2PZH3_ARAVE|nr:hypothetical protein AVEN_220791-1 [Araneus ventricosus]
MALGTGTWGGVLYSYGLSLDHVRNISSERPAERRSGNIKKSLVAVPRVRWATQEVPLAVPELVQQIKEVPLSVDERFANRKRFLVVPRAGVRGKSGLFSGARKWLSR